MNARQDILERIRTSRPEHVDLPGESETFLSGKSDGNQEVINSWVEQAQAAGSVVHHVPDLTAIHEWVRARTWNGPLFSTAQGVHGDPFLDQIPTTTNEMAKTDLLIVESGLGVAENGAVWITDETAGPRALPFLCREIAVILPSSRILPTMHDAYRELGTGPIHWGLFIGAPSKTADIEQSLVIGAHGPEALTLFLMDQKP